VVGISPPDTLAEKEVNAARYSHCPLISRRRLRATGESEELNTTQETETNAARYAHCPLISRLRLTASDESEELDSSPPRIERAGPDDIEAILALEQECFPNDAWSKEYIQEYLEDSVLDETIYPDQWQVLTDPDSDAKYYRNPETRRTMWAMPVEWSRLQTSHAAWKMVRGERTVGYIAVCVYTYSDFGPGQEWVGIHSLGIAKSARRQGFARMLMEAMFKNYPSAQRFELMVSTKNGGAQRLYTKTGFRVVDKIDKYYGPGDDGFYMIKECSRRRLAASGESEKLDSVTARKLRRILNTSTPKRIPEAIHLVS